MSDVAWLKFMSEYPDFALWMMLNQKDTTRSWLPTNSQGCMTITPGLIHAAIKFICVCGTCHVGKAEAQQGEPTIHLNTEKPHDHPNPNPNPVKNWISLPLVLVLNPITVYDTFHHIQRTFILPSWENGFLWNKYRPFGECYAQNFNCTLALRHLQTCHEVKITPSSHFMWAAWVDAAVNIGLNIWNKIV